MRYRRLCGERLVFANGSALSSDTASRKAAWPWRFTPEVDADECATLSLIDAAHLAIGRVEESDVPAINCASDREFHHAMGDMINGLDEETRACAGRH